MFSTNEPILVLTFVTVIPKGVYRNTQTALYPMYRAESFPTLTSKWLIHHFSLKLQVKVSKNSSSLVDISFRVPLFHGCMGKSVLVSAQSKAKHHFVRRFAVPSFLMYTTSSPSFPSFHMYTGPSTTSFTRI